MLPLLLVLALAAQGTTTAAGIGPAARADRALARDLFVPAGSVWKYLDDGSNQGAAWRAPGFDDSSWAAGRAQLGYGDGDETTVVGFGPDPANKYITTYFRRAFHVADPGAFTALQLSILRDDGAVVYLNGVELLRSNMGPGSVGFGAPADSTVGGEDEDRFYVSHHPPAGLVAGRNVLAVGVHQISGTSSDSSFDLSLVGVRRLEVVRGPYLQRGTPTSMMVRWRTNAPAESWVRYGTEPGSPSSIASSASPTTEHAVELAGLAPDTTYHYSVGTQAEELEGGAVSPGCSFRTAPVTGSAASFRAWVLGDSGTANVDARAVRDAYATFAGSTQTDLVLMLGDNAYNKGRDEEYQAAVFETYPLVLRASPLWPARGNHEDYESVYLDMFSLPTMGEAGGVASGSELYYAFDYANVHFVCLDSDSSDRSVGGAMHTWLASDLASTGQDWIVAFWHHPPYTKGSHDSDTESNLIEMRQNFLPLLESNGVDLVLCGHSHSYERSFLVDGHYGPSSTWNPATMLVGGGDGREDGDGAYAKGAGPNEGAVYCVAGSSGRTSSGSLDHPVMFHSVLALGSVVLDVAGGRMDLTFLDDGALVEDYFTLLKTTAAALTADVTTLSASRGGVQHLLLDGGLELAGHPYALFTARAPEPSESAGGVRPFAGVGVTATGVLDAVGTAEQRVVLPPSAAVELAGETLQHVLLVFDDTARPRLRLRSDAVPLTLGP